MNSFNFYYHKIISICELSPPPPPAYRDSIIAPCLCAFFIHLLINRVVYVKNFSVIFRSSDNKFLRVFPAAVLVSSCSWLKKRSPPNLGEALEAGVQDDSAKCLRLVVSRLRLHESPN